MYNISSSDNAFTYQHPAQVTGASSSSFDSFVDMDEAVVCEFVMEQKTDLPDQFAVIWVAAWRFLNPFGPIRLRRP